MSLGSFLCRETRRKSSSIITAPIDTTHIGSSPRMRICDSRAPDSLGRMATILLTSADPFESPVLGIVVGLGIILVGLLVIRFALPISRFVSSISVQIYGERWAGLLAKTQVVRLRAMGIVQCIFGAAVLIIGLVSALNGL